MYPSLYYLFQDLLGLEIPFLKLVQTFGFFVALAFIAAYQVMSIELRRKEREGILHEYRVKVVYGKPATSWEYILSSVIGFALGYKLFDLLLHFSRVSEDLQGFLFSGQGSLLGGVLGLGIAVYLKYREVKKRTTGGLREEVVTMHPYQNMATIAIGAGVAGILGAKIFHNLENLSDFAVDPWDALFSFSGLTFYGGLICGGAAVLYLASKSHIHWKHMLDVGGPGMMISYGVGRIGCHLSGDGDWGIVNMAAKPDWMGFLPDWLWSYNYPHNVINDGVPIPGCTGRYCMELNPPVFPTPFYEVIAAFLLFGILWAIRKKVKVPGVLFGIYLILAGIERFFIELIRVNNPIEWIPGKPTQAELISVIMILTGIIGIALLSRSKNKRQQQPS